MQRKSTILMNGKSKDDTENTSNMNAARLFESGGIEIYFIAFSGVFHCYFLIPAFPDAILVSLNIPTLNNTLNSRISNV